MTLLVTGIESVDINLLCVCLYQYVVFVSEEVIATYRFTGFPPSLLTQLGLSYFFIHSLWYDKRN